MTQAIVVIAMQGRHDFRTFFLGYLAKVQGIPYSCRVIEIDVIPTPNKDYSDYVLLISVLSRR